MNLPQVTSTLQIPSEEVPLEAKGREVQAAMPGRTSVQALTVIIMLAAALLWCYWPALGHMAERWSSDPQYSHGFLVPVFAVVILWSRRDLLARGMWQPSWLGLGVLGAGLVLKLVAAAMDFEPLDALSFLPSLAGLVLFVGGRELWRFAWPAVAFLGFMLPLPFTIEVALAHPLRSIATTASTYALQTLGFHAFAEGNVILIGDTRLGVAEACSGLGMLMTFFALATAMALISRAPLLDRLVLLASAAPIAVIANVLRITATGTACRLISDEAGHWIMHEVAGWLMMPVALLLLWLEARYFARLFPAMPRDDGPLALIGVPSNGREAATQTWSVNEPRPMAPALGTGSALGRALAPSGDE